jgi:hypothetical protein
MKNKQKKRFSDSLLTPSSALSLPSFDPSSVGASKKAPPQEASLNVINSKNPSPSTASPSPMKKPKNRVKNSYLNLYPLFKEGKDKQKTLFVVFKKLLHELYGKTSLCPQDGQKNSQFIDHLATVLLESFSTQSFEGNFSLENLSLTDASLQPIFYKMLKGTKHYDRDQPFGYPSLLDFIVIQKTATLSLVFAPRETLIALFSLGIAEKIQQYQEKEQFFPISKESFEKIAQQENFPLSPELYKLFNFVKTPRYEKKSEVLFLEKKTGIKIRKKSS